VKQIDADAAAALDRPVVIAAFEGWNDAGEAATDAVDHLLTKWKAVQVAEMDPEEYYDFQVNRPHVGFDPNGQREVSWRTTKVWACRRSPGPDVLLVTGIEPNLRWKAFCAELLDFFVGQDATLFVTLGALLADVPHTRPVPITGATSDAELAERYHLEPSHYTGPTGIVGVLSSECTRRGVPAMSIWAAVPHYVAQPPCPKATVALLGRLEDVLDVSIDLGNLPEESAAWQRGVDELAEDDGDVAAYVRSLEEERDTADLPEASGDAIAKEFERYLKRRSDES
jgi:proteasome assembly chaperone (PAC2) family protein